MASHGDDDLAASQTEGYKAGQKKTLEEYQNLGKWHIMVIASLELECTYLHHRKAALSFSAAPLSWWRWSATLKLYLIPSSLSHNALDTHGN